MSRLLYFFAAICFLPSCKPQQKATTEVSAKKQEFQTSTPTVAMTLQIIYTADYCGGAAPSDQILEDVKRKKPLKSEKVYIRKQGQKEYIEAVSDATGSCTVELGLGKYDLFLKEKVETKAGQSPLVDKNRCETWKKSPDSEFTVGLQTQRVSVEVHRICNPCYPPAY